MKRTIKCPQCQQPTLWQDNRHRPFCSERCKLIDLGSWADESYRIPSGSPATQEEVEEVINLNKNIIQKGHD